MKQTLNVDIYGEKQQSYNIFISDEAFSKMMEELRVFCAEKKCLYIVSKRVYEIYKDSLLLDDKDYIIINDGEKEKNFKNYIKILKKAAELGMTRDDVLVALGGGVIGDITGFAASTYMRGIDYIQIPTTLLSMVDSSVGGKTAIDLEQGKNLVGSFYQPKAVFININFLKTLNEKQYMSGLGEIIKYAFIEDNCGYKHSLFFFEYLTLCCEKLLDKEAMTLMRVIEYCLNLKISVVTKDEKESGLRKILNLGHTLAHAIETKTKYKKYTHGQAVIYGIYFILNWAYSENLITYSYYRLSVELLAKYGFKPLDVSKIFKSKDLLEIMKKDKKATKDKILFIVPCDKKKVKEVTLSFEEVLRMF